MISKREFSAPLSLLRSCDEESQTIDDAKWEIPSPDAECHVAQGGQALPVNLAGPYQGVKTQIEINHLIAEKTIV